MQVKAVKPGVYGNVYRVIGSKFTIQNEEEFSKNWMEHVEAEKPAKEEKKADAPAPKAQGQKPESKPKADLSGTTLSFDNKEKS